MLEIMLSKLHVTSLAIKEQMKRGTKKRELARPPPGAFLFFFSLKPRPSQEVCFSGAVIWARARRKAETERERKKKISTRGVKCEGKWKTKLCYTVACAEWERESTAVFAQRLVL